MTNEMTMTRGCSVVANCRHQKDLEKLMYTSWHSSESSCKVVSQKASEKDSVNLLFLLNFLMFAVLGAHAFAAFAHISLDLKQQQRKLGMLPDWTCRGLVPSTKLRSNVRWSLEHASKCTLVTGACIQLAANSIAIKPWTVVESSRHRQA